MKFCSHNQCNREIPDSARHCPFCGQAQARTIRSAQPFFLVGISMLSIMVILLINSFSSGAVPPNILVNTPTQKSTATNLPRPSPQATTFISSTPIPVTYPAVGITRTPLTPTPTGISTSSSCPGALPSRIQINDLVQVVTTNRDRLVLRSSPEINDRTELQRLNTGTRLKIFDGPVCVQDPVTSIYYWFWEVRVKSTDVLGWVAEGDRSLYYLEFIR
jgi:hypothetical protein